MTQSDNDFLGYLKFSGPSVDDGEINVGKIGKTLLALDNLFKKYIKTSGKDATAQLQIKVKNLKKGSTEVQIIIEQIMPIAQPVAKSASWLLLAKATGITEFGKQFFGTIAQQLVLKMFSKGKRLKEGETFLRDQSVYIKLVNINGEEKNIPIEDWKIINYFTVNLRI